MLLICWTRQRRSETGTPKRGIPVERQELISKVQHRDQMSSTQLLLLYGTRDHMQAVLSFLGRVAERHAMRLQARGFAWFCQEHISVMLLKVACIVWKACDCLPFVVRAMLLQLHLTRAGTPTLFRVSPTSVHERGHARNVPVFVDCSVDL